MQITKLFEYSPLFEILVKNLYWRVGLVHNYLEKIKNKNRKKRTSAATEKSIDFDKIEEALIRNGVSKGDILIVHSSMSSLKATGLTEKEIIIRLKALVGESGTIAMPSIPIIKNEPSGLDMLDETKYAAIFEYNVQKSPPWTGSLPKALAKFDGAVRSRHPLNTMTAYGLHAEDMMRRNLEGYLPTPHGLGSSWDYCYKNGAKIIMLGVDLAHSITMIHLAEDLFESSWPIKNWNRTRSFKIIDGTYTAEVKVRQRRHTWSVFYAERSFSRDLYKNGIAKHECIDGLDISYCESDKLISYLNSRKSEAYPYRIPFMNILSKFL
jgi:aminoglycoside 3-N-acetyltransferase